MSPNRRIILNIVSTYGRTVIGVLCGIFSTRWVLMALGKEDFGLFGLVGSLVIFLSFFNSYFSGALSRFYAYAIGQAKVAVDVDLALEESRKWFSIGVAIHTVVPLVLIAIGYPIGAWAIRSGVVGVPSCRIYSCVWLWRFVCVSSLVAMASVPFSAMYTAKQYIAELTIYSLAQTLVRTGFIYYMTLRAKDWLVTYGLVTCLIAIVPQILICLRAFFVFRECRFCFKYLALLGYVKRLGAYVGWQIFGGLGYLARFPFMTVVVNRFFGPQTTASFTIGVSVSGEASALTGALNMAFTPAITSACGEGCLDRLRMMAYQASKFGTLLTLLFAIPIGLEMSEILRIWLNDVPQWAEGICLIMLIVTVVDKFSLGHYIGVNAIGRVSRFQVCRGLACLTAVPLAMVAAVVFHHVYAVAIALLMATCVATFSNIWLARKLVGLSARYWFFRIILPLCLVSLVTCVLGFVPHFFMDSSFVRVVVTAGITFASMLPLSLVLVLDCKEREYLLRKFMAVIKGVYSV